MNVMAQKSPFQLKKMFDMSVNPWMIAIHCDCLVRIHITSVRAMGRLRVLPL